MGLELGRGGMAGPDKRSSPPVDNIEHGAKMASGHAIVPVVKHETRQEVAEERGEGEVAHGGGPLFAPEPATQIDVRVDVKLLHCQACLLPLKPPIFKCEHGHVVCCYCHGGHGKVCRGAVIRCSELDAFICATKVSCPYNRFGCDSYIVYHDVQSHRHACRCAPCSCPETTCRFLGSPSALLDHFAADHSRPIFAVSYGVHSHVILPLWQRWHVLVGVEDQSVFVVTLGELGAAATAMSLVCVRADGAAAAAEAPQFWCKLSVKHPDGDKGKDISVAKAVSSNTLFGDAPVPGQEMFLAVPQEYTFCKMLTINVRIDQVHSVDASTNTTF